MDNFRFQTLVVTNLRVWLYRHAIKNSGPGFVVISHRRLYQHSPLRDDGQTLNFEPGATPPFYHIGGITDPQGLLRALDEAKAGLDASESALGERIASEIVGTTGYFDDAMMNPSLAAELQGSEVLYAGNIQSFWFILFILTGGSFIPLIVLYLYWFFSGQLRENLSSLIGSFCGWLVMSLVGTVGFFLALRAPGHRIYLTKNTLLSYYPSFLCLRSKITSYPLNHSWLPLTICLSSSEASSFAMTSRVFRGTYNIVCCNDQPGGLIDKSFEPHLKAFIALTLLNRIPQTV